MKKPVVLFLGVFLALSKIESLAAPVLSDNFNSYANGNLVGQGTWAQTSTSATSPVQVNNGVVTIGSSGQDIYDPFSSPVTLSDGQSIYFGLTLDVTAAQATGDYFMHFTPSPGNSSLFYDRVYVQSSGSGYVLGSLGTSGGNPVYGTTVLSFGTSYNFVLAYNFSATTPTNSTDALYINPTDPTVGNNSAYLTASWGSATTDTNTIAAVNFRQGTASAASTETVDNLVVSETFGDVLAVPEPSILTLVSMGGMTCLVALRSKR